MTTWFKMYDAFDEHPKVIGLSDAAYRLWVSAMCYTSRNLTNGVVPAAIAARLVPHADPAELVAAGLWLKPDDEHPTAYRIHEYLEYQRSKEKVTAERAGAAERQARSRAKRAKEKAEREASRRDADVTPPVTGGGDGATGYAGHTVTHASVTPQEAEAEAEANNPQPAPPAEPSAEALHALAFAGVPDGALVIGPGPLAKAIGIRADQLNHEPEAIACWLNDNLRAAPLPDPIGRPFGFLQFRLSQVVGPNGPAVTAATSAVLASYQPPTPEDRAIAEGMALDTNEEVPTMTPTQAMRAARANLGTAAAS